MNFLAHLYLAGDSKQLIIGNFLGDFVKGMLTNQYNPEITKGIILHRKIDVYTDASEIVKKTRKLISPERRRYGGIILDVAFDHFLIKNWDNYSDIELDDFIDSVCSVLVEYKSHVPENASNFIEGMIKNNWFDRYRSLEGIAEVFAMMSLRFKRKNILTGSEIEISNNYDEIQKSFKLFFPGLIEYVEKLKNEL